MPDQLQMIWPRVRVTEPIVRHLPEGYLLRNFQEGDDNAYVNLMQRARFGDWGHDTLKTVLETVTPNGIWFVEYRGASEIVATATGGHKPSRHFADGGELGWVACSPEHTGKGLGYVVCAAATHRLLEQGCRQIYLLTNDFRLAAIKTYLKLGYVPFYCGPDMRERWRIVMGELSLNEADYGGVDIRDIELPQGA